MCLFVFLFVSVVFRLYSLLRRDPLKSSLGLLISVITSAYYYMPISSFFIIYYLVLLILRGVLVVVITITGLSKFTFGYRRGLLLFLSRTTFFPFYSLCSSSSEDLTEIYSRDYFGGFFLLLFIIFLLLLFIKIMLNNKGALRKF